jgi:hypothetical protein
LVQSGAAYQGGQSSSHRPNDGVIDGTRGVEPGAGGRRVVLGMRVGSGVLRPLTGSWCGRGSGTFVETTGGCISKGELSDLRELAF